MSFSLASSLWDENVYEPEFKSNWLPAPDGPFALALRIYWPEQDVLDGTWTPPSIVRKA
ncbi:hypothetical protein ACFLYD_06330 [Chloroflexota bacterium]